MRTNLYKVFVIAFFTIAILSGCKNLTPMEASQSAADETRMLISKNISDEVREKKLIALVNQLESDLNAYNEKQIAHNKAIVLKNTDYNASRKKMQRLYDAFNRDTKSIYMLIAKTHLEMKQLTTREEWAVISKQKHRIGGY